MHTWGPYPYVKGSDQLESHNSSLDFLNIAYRGCLRIIVTACMDVHPIQFCFDLVFFLIFSNCKKFVKLVAMMSEESVGFKDCV